MAVLPQNFDPKAIQSSVGSSSVVRMANLPEDILHASFYNIASLYLPVVAKH